VIEVDSVVKFVSSKELFQKGLVPFLLISGTVLIIIIVTIFLVRKEIKGVKKNEKN
jgi:hypothetical protein